MVRLFGASFDPLDIAERVDVKRAYLKWLGPNQADGDDFSDPYDFLEKALKHEFPSVKNVEWIGQFPVASWLRPKPLASDLNLVSQEVYTQFLDQNGCFDYYNKLLDYLGREVRTAIPVMIGVDHCLSGAVLTHLKYRYDEHNVLVFDSHCDLIDIATRRSYFQQLSPSIASHVGEDDIYECGSFIDYLLVRKIINPEKLWIIGTQDLDGVMAGAFYVQKILHWIEQGVHILSKKQIVSEGIPDEIKGPTYISFDMDLGSLSSVFAARFLNYFGLDTDQFRSIITELSQRIRSKKIELIGLDIMEMDIHFLGESVNGCRDYAGELAKEITLRLVYNNFIH